MIFRSPHEDLNLPPADSTLLPTFLLACVEEQGAEGTESARSDVGKRIDTPFLYPAPTDGIFQGRPRAKPLSLRDVHERAFRLAKGLLDGRAGQPFKRGDVVALYSSNQHDYIVAIFGIHLAGGIVALCNPSYRPHELAHQLRMTGAQIIITNATLPTKSDEGKSRQSPLECALEAADQAATEDDDDAAGSFKRLERRCVVFVFDDEHERGLSNVYASTKLTADDYGAIQERTKSVKGDDAAVYCFSSGTSGLPKAVILTHHNLVANTIQATFLLHDRMNEPLFDGRQYSKDGKTGWYDNAEKQGAGMRKGDGKEGERRRSAVSKLASKVKAKFPLGSPEEESTDSNGANAAAARPETQQEFHIDVLPQFHCYGLLVDLVATHTCTPRVIFPRFHLETFLACISKYHVTFGFVVPPILLALAKHPKVDDFDLSSLGRVASGAAALPDEIVDAVSKRLGICCTDGYGMSEMSPIISMQTVADADKAPSTVGALAPNTRAIILGEDGKSQLGPGEAGALVLHGPQMMAGYLHNEVATAEAFTSVKGDDGQSQKWLQTGDVARIDERGYITITDRLKDVIKAKGFQVSPAELEGLIFKDQRIQDTAVVGVKGKDGAEQPWAYLVLREGESHADDVASQVIAAVNKRVAGYKRIEGATCIEALPKNDAGKVLKKELRARFTDSQK